jgi:aspartokinase
MKVGDVQMKRNGKAKKHTHLLGRFLLWQIRTSCCHRKNKRARRAAAARKESEPMRKSGLIAVVAALAAVAGALVAIAVYLRRREKELDEYEHLLFSEDFSDDTTEEDSDADKVEAAPEQPASDDESAE